MQQQSSMPSKKCLSESLRDISCNYVGNHKIILETMSKLALEDDYYVDFIPKITQLTKLDNKIVIEAFKEFMKDPKFNVQMRTIAEDIEPL